MYFIHFSTVLFSKRTKKGSKRTGRDLFRDWDEWESEDIRTARFFFTKSKC